MSVVSHIRGGKKLQLTDPVSVDEYITYARNTSISPDSFQLVTLGDNLALCKCVLIYSSSVSFIHEAGTGYTAIYLTWMQEMSKSFDQ